MILILIQLNAVAYEEGHSFKLKKELFLEDALSDLPPVCNRLYQYVKHKLSMIYVLSMLCVAYLCK